MNFNLITLAAFKWRCRHPRATHGTFSGTFTTRYAVVFDKVRTTVRQ